MFAEKKWSIYCIWKRKLLTINAQKQKNSFLVLHFVHNFQKRNAVLGFPKRTIWVSLCHVDSENVTFHLYILLFIKGICCIKVLQNFSYPQKSSDYSDCFLRYAGQNFMRYFLLEQIQLMSVLRRSSLGILWKDCSKSVFQLSFQCLLLAHFHVK